MEVTDVLYPVCRLTGELQRGLKQASSAPAALSAWRCLRRFVGPLWGRTHMRTGKDCVLVVDDYQDAADTLVELLHVHDIEAYACHSAEEGFALATRLRPTVVIIEPTVSGKVVNGMQLAAMLRHGGVATRPLLIALAGRGRQQDIAAAVQGGFDAFLLKPSCWDDLFALIRPGARQQGTW
jgi:CheY-like chemotaxis protein